MAAALRHFHREVRGLVAPLQVLRTLRDDALLAAG